MIVDVIVAFGGANKNGWRGVKYANLDQILADNFAASQDSAARGEIYGLRDDSEYLYVADGAHMGDASTFTSFLNFVKTNYINYDEQFLAMWDHGAGYDGFGNDENFQMDPLSLDEIDQSLSTYTTGGNAFDLIGYDACLMASIEVAKRNAPHADYMLASEELEPGHGW